MKGLVQPVPKRGNRIGQASGGVNPLFSLPGLHVRQQGVHTPARPRKQPNGQDSHVRQRVAKRIGVSFVFWLG
jgi:hypothetical protein